MQAKSRKNGGKNETMAIPHMLTIKQTAKLFNMPEHSVRVFAREDQTGARLYTIMAGKKYLVNQERFAAFLNGAFSNPAPAQPQSVDGITPVQL